MRVAMPVLPLSGRADRKAHFEVYAIFVDSHSLQISIKITLKIHLNCKLKT